METWGDQDYIGLTGIELFGADGNLIQLPEDAVSGLWLTSNNMGELSTFKFNLVRQRRFHVTDLLFD